MADLLNMNINGRSAQLTYQTTVGALVGGLTPEIVLPGGNQSHTILYNLAGAGSLQMQRSVNDPREVQTPLVSPFAQLWSNIGTASTGAATQSYDGTGSIQMVRGLVTGGAGSDVLTITISASFINA